MTGKVFIVGLDGGTWTILKPAMDQGYMPHLRSLVERGVSGNLESTIPAITPAAWGSFQTGVNPGKNGVFDFSYWDRRHRRQYYVSSNSLQKTIWEMASQGGKRVAAINVPMTFPPRAINSYIVSGLLTPSIDSEFTYPQAFKDDLLDHLPDYQILDLKQMKGVRLDENFDAFVQEMAHLVQLRKKAAEYVLGKGPFDLFMVHFQAVDAIQHALWWHLDPSHPMYDPERWEYILERFYRPLDDAVSQLQTEFDRSAQGDTLSLIISDHGFQTHSKRFNLGNWLHEQGYLALSTKSFDNKTPRSIEWLKKLDFLNLRKLLLSPDHRADIAKSLGRLSPYDWAETRALSVGRSNEGLIYLLGESAEERYERAIDLTKRLCAIRDPESDAVVVEHVYRKDEIFSGPYMDRMPDLIIEPKGGYSFTGHYQPDAGLFHIVNAEDDYHLGRHHRDGILIATGEHIQSQEDLRAGIMDIVPTLLCYFFLPVPDNLDGHVLEELIPEGHRIEPDPTKVIYPESPDQKGSDYSKEEKQKIEDRLRGLGYL